MGTAHWLQRARIAEFRESNGGETPHVVLSIFERIDEGRNPLPHPRYRQAHPPHTGEPPNPRRRAHQLNDRRCLDPEAVRGFESPTSGWLDHRHRASRARREWQQGRRAPPKRDGRGRANRRPPPFAQHLNDRAHRLTVAEATEGIDDSNGHAVRAAIFGIAKRVDESPFVPAGDQELKLPSPKQGPYPQLICRRRYA